MTSTSPRDSFDCDYLHPYIPYVFASETAEFAYVKNQICSLDDHIYQLSTLRRTLQHRSNQLHNVLAPVNMLPPEVLSRIYLQLIDSQDGHGVTFEEHRICLRQALVLSSVSVYFRRVALFTPQLWKKIPLWIPTCGDIARASSLFQHCMCNAARAPDISVSVLETLDKKGARSVMDTLLTSDVAQKIRAFGLSGSAYATDLWIQKLQSFSFPVLDTFSISCNKRNASLDLRTLSTTTQLEISKPLRDRSILMPSSVRYLHLKDVEEPILVAILYQCPNLEECLISDREYIYVSVFGVDAKFHAPLTLPHLKRLTLSHTLTTHPFSVENLQLPSLEYLHFDNYDDLYGDYCEFFALCGNLSATLTTLKIDLHTELDFDDDRLYELCGSPFPNLRTLAFTSLYHGCIFNFIRALTRQAEEHGDAEPYYLSTLTALTLGCRHERVKPRWIMDLLEKWRVGEESCFHMKVKGSELTLRAWPQKLRKKLRSIVGSRQIKLTWGGSEIL